MKYDKSVASITIQEFNLRLKYIKPNADYDKLSIIMSDEKDWHKAHAIFSDIRINTTLSFRGDGTENFNIEYHFSFVAEQAAKVIYNCSGQSAPFDSNSYDRFVESVKKFDNILYNLRIIAQDVPKATGHQKRL